jgi:hypothetical protein
MDVRDMERRSFVGKLYDQATSFVHAAEQMEIMERDSHYQKLLEQMQKDEARLKAKHVAVLNTLHKRIQRDRDE